MRGTAVCFKNNLNCYPASYPNPNTIDALGITLNIPGSPPLTFFSVYIPHNESASDVMTDINALLTSDANSFLIGDFNAHHTFWNCSANNDYGNKIYNHLLNSTADILFPNSPTRVTNTSSSTIDFGLYNGFNYVKDISSLAELSSDHNPLKINIQIKTPILPPRIIKRINWAQYKNLINEIPPTLPTINNTNDIDNFVSSITNDIKNAADKATSDIKSNEFYKTDPYVRRLTTNKNRARKIFQRTRSVLDKQILNRAQQELKNYLYKRRQENWNNYLSNLTPEDTSLWTAARKIKSSVTNFPPVIIPNTTNYAYSNEEKADAIARSLEMQFQGNPIIDYETEREVNTTVRQFLSTDCPTPNFRITNADVFNQIKKLKNKKSPGVSKITNEMLKNLPTSYIPKLTLLINSIFKLSYFPHQWKTALIAPIPKSGKPPHLPSSYRPISLLNSLSKLTEAFIAQQINLHIQQNNIISPNQFGFQSKLSATHQVYRLVELIAEGKLNKKFTAAVFLDIEKAFDKVWIFGLIYKLIDKKFPPYLIKLIYRYLLDRNFHVKIKDILSGNLFAPFGLPQGSKLSATLFNLYINDMPTENSVN